MALKVRWSDNAEATFLEILTYLEGNWTQKEVERFVKRTETLLSNITNHPYIFKRSQSQNVYRAVVFKQNSLIYRITKTHIYLLTFLDNRQDPAKSKYKF